MRVSPIIGRASSGPTYEQFLAHIEGRATLPNTTADSGTGASTYAVIMTMPTGSLGGTPWGSQFVNGTGGRAGRIVQHSLPSEAEFLSQIAAGRKVFLRIVGAGNNTNVPGLNRNGYESNATTGTGNKNICPECVYFGPYGPEWMNPQAQTGPFPYTWT